MALTQVQGGMLAGSTNTTTTIQSNGTTAITIDSSQKVGIGTASPTGKLHVYGSGEVQTLQRSSGSANNYTLFKTESGADQAYLGFSDAGVNDFAIYNVQNGYIRFGTNNSERMRIASDGAISAGSTTSTVGLGVWSNFGSRIIDFARYADDGAIVGFKRGGTLVGNISVTGSATAYNTSSDYRLKENITPMAGALATVSALKPVTYKWKVDGSDGQGFIAHELAEVVPQAVSGEKDAIDKDGNPEYQGVDTSFLVATLTAAIQELNAKVEAQAAEIAALKAAP